MLDLGYQQLGGDNRCLLWVRCQFCSVVQLYYVMVYGHHLLILLYILGITGILAKPVMTWVSISPGWIEVSLILCLKLKPLF